MRPLGFLVFSLCLLAFSSCHPDAAIDWMVSKGDRDVTTYYIDLLRDQNFYPIERDMDPSLKGDNLPTTLKEMSRLIPKGKPLSVKIVGVNAWGTPGASEKNITLEYEYPGKWLLANVATRTTKSHFTIIGFRILPLPDSLENINRFTLAGKTPIHYAVFGFVILVPLFIVFSLVQCARTKMKRKWLWMIFIGLGVCKFSIDWTSGQWLFLPLSVELLGAGATAPFYGPWTLSVSLPLGALLFLLLRKKLSLKIAPEIAPAP
jgi:hypothetical protein